MTFENKYKKNGSCLIGLVWFLVLYWFFFSIWSSVSKNLKKVTHFVNIHKYKMIAEIWDLWTRRKVKGKKWIVLYIYIYIYIFIYIYITIHTPFETNSTPKKPPFPATSGMSRAIDWSIVSLSKLQRLAVVNFACWKKHWSSIQGGAKLWTSAVTNPSCF